jgi:integrase
MSPRSTPRKPWFHAPSGFWCAQVAGKRHYLDRDPDKAQRKLNKLLADRQRRRAGQPDWLDAPLVQLADTFLDDVKNRKCAGTYADYRNLLERARTYLGDDLTVGEVRKFHLAKLEQAMHGRYSPTTVYKTLHAVQRVFAWAVEVEILDYSPLVGYRKPRPRQRTRVIAPEEFRRMLRHSDVVFRRVLLALRLTGCRPGELRALRWEHVDLEGGIWVLPEHKTVTRQRQPRPRVIALPEPVLRLVCWLARQPHDSQDPVFRNRAGRPWTREAFHSRMTRLRERAGLEPLGGERIVLYSARHTYGTDALGKVTDIELAELMGHTNTATTRRYVHLNAQRLRDIQKRAQG